MSLQHLPRHGSCILNGLDEAVSDMDEGFQEELNSKGTGKLQVGGSSYDLSNDMVAIAKETKKVSGRYIISAPK